jgi:tripeptide aminopeptidase
MIDFSPDFTQHLLEQACQIQQIPAPTFDESRRAAWVADQFRSLALSDIQSDGAGNVLACWPGTAGAQPLVLSAHLDTVFPLDVPLTLDRQPNQIYGPGIGDNSLGVSALLGLGELLQLQSRHYRGDIWLTATTGEEGLGNLRGIQAVVDRFGAMPVAYISLEGLGLGNILHRGLGVERLRVTVRCAGGHSWVDFGQPSAVHHLLVLGSRVAGLRVPRRPRTSLNIGRIEGGTSVNTIASQASMEIDLRSEGVRALERLGTRVRQALSDETQDVQVEVERIGRRPAGDIPSSHKLVRLAQSILSELGLSSNLDIASTEANIPLSLGYPSITLGLTSGGKAHTRQEYIDTIPFQKGFKQIVLLVEGLLL